jgi:hypothetical protein
VTRHDDLSPVDPVDQVFQDWATAIAKRWVANPDRVRLALTRLNDTFGAVPPTDPTRPVGPWEFPFSLLDDALFALSPDQALELFESENLLRLSRRVAAVDYLSDEEIPLFSLQELGDHIAAFLTVLKGDRAHLVKTGLPSARFRRCPWLDRLLGRLYGTRVTDSPWPRTGRPWVGRGADPGNVPPYLWLRMKAGDAPYPYEACSYEEAAYLRGLCQADASRLEGIRGRLFELKLAILEEAGKALSRGDSAGLWPDCRASILSALRSDEIRDLLRLDRNFSMPDFLWLGETGAGNPMMIPGGLSNLLELIGSVEEELSVGTYWRTRGELGDLAGDSGGVVDPEGGRVGYFEILAMGKRAQADAAADVFLHLTRQEDEFWAEFEGRVLSDLGDESDVKWPMWQTVKRKHLGELLARRGDFSLGYAVTEDGVVRPLVPRRGEAEHAPEPAAIDASVRAALSRSDEVPRQASTSADNRFLRAGALWEITFAGKTIRLPHRKGLAYLHHLVSRPGKDVDVVSLAGMFGTQCTPRGVSKKDSDGDGTAAWAFDGDDKILDDPALAELAREMRKLRKQLDDAEEFDKEDEIAALTRKLDELKSHADDVIRQGQSKTFNPTTQKARKAVSKAIEESRALMEVQHPELYRHLVDSINTGYKCSYKPTPRTSWLT